MVREYMVGTVDDKPLLALELNGKNYFVDMDKGEVYLDEPGLPRVTDKDEVLAVLDKANVS